MTRVTATEAIKKQDEEMQRRILHERVQWFFEKHSPDDKRDAAEFQADFQLVVQAIHRDASTHTHELLSRSLAAMPSPTFMTQTDK